MELVNFLFFYYYLTVFVHVKTKINIEYINNLQSKTYIILGFCFSCFVFKTFKTNNINIRNKLFEQKKKS